MNPQLLPDDLALASLPQWRDYERLLLANVNLEREIILAQERGRELERENLHILELLSHVEPKLQAEATKFDDNVTDDEQNESKKKKKKEKVPQIVKQIDTETSQLDELSSDEEATIRLSSLTTKKRKDGEESSRPLKTLNGKPVVPFFVSQRTGDVVIVEKIGDVVQGEGFQTSRNIFPLGFVSKVRFQSVHRPGQRTWYTTKILKRSNGCLCTVTAEDIPGKQWSAAHPQTTWKKVFDDMTAMGNPPPRNHPIAIEMTGLHDSSLIAHLNSHPFAKRTTRKRGRESFHSSETDSTTEDSPRKKKK